MNRAWKDRMLKEPEYAAKRAYAKEAWQSGFWIYCVPTGKWYTPTEFMESGESVRINRGKEISGKFVVRDPLAGITEKVDTANQLLREAEEMKNKHIEYMKQKAKNK